MPNEAPARAGSRASSTSSAASSPPTSTPWISHRTPPTTVPRRTATRSAWASASRRHDVVRTRLDVCRMLRRIGRPARQVEWFPCVPSRGAPAAEADGARARLGPGGVTVRSARSNASERTGPIPGRRRVQDATARPSPPPAKIMSGISGERGIRTLGRLAPTHDFQSCTFGHSVISPEVAPLSTLAGSDDSAA